MSLRSYKSEFLLGSVTIVIMLLMVLLNDVNLHVRIKELRIFMQMSNREDNNNDHIGLVMKYRLQKKIFENIINQDEADITELTVNSILAKTMNDQSIYIDRYHYLSIPSVFAINLFRKIINKEPIRNMWENPANVYLAIAYYYERNNCFAKAMEIYDNALKAEKNNTNTKASIILHQGYCSSIMGNYEVARNKYTYVTRNFSDKPVAITALILLKYLDGFKSELNRILKDENDSIGKSEKLCRLIAYRDAIDVINRIENNTGPADQPRLKYIKGMCFEGLSEKDKAIDTYQSIIREYKNSNYARLSNRRLYIIGATAFNGDKLKNMAIGNNEVIRDPVFNKMLEQESKLNVPGVTGYNPLLKHELGIEESLYPALRLQNLNFSNMLKRSVPADVNQNSDITIKVNTSDGDIFVGVKKEETGEYIKIETMVGIVKIPKKKIEKITRIRQ